MKEIAIAAIALVFGLIVGGVSPRAELRSVEKELEEASREVSRAGVGRDLARLFRSPPASSSPCGPIATRRTEDPRDAAIREVEELTAENPDVAEEVEQLDAEQDEALEEVAEGLSEVSEEQLDAARIALDLRRAQTRAALVEQLDPSVVQLEGVNQAFDGMNDVLVDLSEELAVMLDNDIAPDRRDAMEFASEALQAMLEAEEGARSQLDGDQLEQATSDILDPFKWIDPDILAALERLGTVQ